MKRKYILIVFILLFSILVSSTSSEIYSKDSSPVSPLLSNALSPHDPISILGDSTFDSYGFPGSGSPTEPYLIENLFIETTGVGIEIKSTTKYFKIQYCTIVSSDKCIFINSVATGTVTIAFNILTSVENEGISIMNGCHESTIKNNIIVANWTALDLFNCDESLISGNNFSDSRQGLYLEDSDYCLIKDNTISNNGFGMLVAFSTHATITNNHVINNTLEGIATDSGDDSVIANNYCSHNKFGIFALVATNLDITNNTLEYNQDGIRFESCDNADIKLNNIQYNSGSGICLSWSDSSSIHYNNISENSYYGLIINATSMFNVIYQNNFFYNFGVSSQGFCSDSSNSWYSEVLLSGNYWTDLSGDSYVIDGPAECIDLYPLDSIFIAPIPTSTPPPTPTTSETESNTTTINSPLFSLISLLVLPILLRKKK